MLFQLTMHKYFKKLRNESSSPSNFASENSQLNQETSEQNTQTQAPNFDATPNPSSSARSQVDLSTLQSDPGERKLISHYHPNEHDEVRRAYIQKGPYQPRNHVFPQRMMSGNLRRFNESWFDMYGNWLEYSVKEDAAFCLCCYLFKNEHESSSHFGGDTFTTKGFRSWNKTERFKMHVGGPNSVHNQCVKRCEDLMMQKQSIQTALDKQSEQTKSEYYTRLNASVDIVRLLLFSALPFRGHDESEFSRRKGLFKTFLKFHAEKK